MRIAFGLIGLLLTLAIVGVLVRKQLASPSARTASGVAAQQPVQPAAVPAQYQKALESALQQTRPVPDGAEPGKP
jgi:hypothetical protein